MWNIYLKGLFSLLGKLQLSLLLQHIVKRSDVESGHE